MCTKTKEIISRHFEPLNQPCLHSESNYVPFHQMMLGISIRNILDSPERNLSANCPILNVEVGTNSFLGWSIPDTDLHDELSAVITQLLVPLPSSLHFLVVYLDVNLGKPDCNSIDFL